MKKLDKLVLLSFSGPFILTLFTVVFILLTPVLIRFGDELVGKDLGIGVILELFGYMAIKSTQDAIPLAILIASLISFGNLGEHSEITAIKSAGISLLRVLFPLFILVLLITGAAFINNNNIVPKANLKFWSLLWDVRQKKPSLNLKEGVFYYDIPNYSIKAEKKYEDGAMRSVLIYDHSSQEGNTDVIIADSGRMYTFNNDQYLMLELYDGYSYSENSQNSIKGISYLDREKIKEFFRSEFDSSRMVFSMESFEMTRTREELFQGSRLMKNMAELKAAADSVKDEKYLEYIRLFSSVNNSYNYYLNGKFEIPAKPEEIDSTQIATTFNEGLEDLLPDSTATQADSSVVSGQSLNPPPANLQAGTGSSEVNRIQTARSRREQEEQNQIREIITDQGNRITFTEFTNPKKSYSMDSLPDFDKNNLLFLQARLQDQGIQSRAFGNAQVQARAIKNTLEVFNQQLGNIQKEANKFELEYHGKVARAVTCLIMFLIGAPLGAIIKRGGLGVPVLIAVGFFIFYYSLTIAAEKFGKEGLLSPFMAMWMANFLLLPVGLFFLRQARVDARLFDADFYATFLAKWFGKKAVAPAGPKVESLDDLEAKMEEENQSSAGTGI